MAFDRSDRPRLPTAIKILVAGGFGAGKTTLVGAVSETRPLRTEEILTDRGIGIDDISSVEAKRTTTVAMDFGRITLSPDYVLYLFGTPGQERFWFVWDELAEGSLGAVILADTRRLADCFPSIDYFERRGTPFVVAVNCFEGSQTFELDEVRLALQLNPSIPIIMCDARKRDSSREVLITLVKHSAKLRAEPVAP
ncbi:ATP/GTP-binding protein [Nonomuraea sp. NPDC050680]|jgi:signal recognition particle receptor subunit beta|uniref:GTP-binding protein n=1 Tax=Nonomuraea sp. NPDC050680 TaxID=3154630 RepID=UPI0033D9B5E3